MSVNENNLSCEKKNPPQVFCVYSTILWWFILRLRQNQVVVVGQLTIKMASSENWFCTYCKTVKYVEIKYIYTYKNIFFYQFIFFFTFSSRRQETSDTINWTQNLQLTGLQSYHTNQPQATVTGLDDVQAPLREDVVTELAESFRVDGAKGWATSLTMCWIWLGGNTALFSN